MNSQSKNSCTQSHIKTIKTDVIYFEKSTKVVNDFDICAPIGINIDINTGQITSIFFIEILEPLVLNPTIKGNSIILNGNLHVKLIFKNPEPCPCTDLKKEFCEEVYIPIQCVLFHDIQCDNSIKIETNNKILSTTISGFPSPNHKDIGIKNILTIKTIIKIDCVLLKEETLKVYNCI